MNSGRLIKNLLREDVEDASKLLGLVLGFQIPALNILIEFFFNSLAVEISCSLLSALQGPAIIRGFLRPSTKEDNLLIFISIK